MTNDWKRLTFKLIKPKHQIEDIVIWLLRVAVCKSATGRPKEDASTVNRTQGLKIFSLALSQLSYRGSTFRPIIRIQKIILSFTIIEQIVRVFQICVRAFKAIER